MSGDDAAVIYLLTDDELAEAAAAPVTALPITAAAAATSPLTVGAGRDDPFSDAALDRLTARKLLDLRARDRAQELHRSERRGQLVVPEPTSLKDLLAQPDEAARFRIAALWPLSGRVMLSAAQKTGKTTLVGNLVRTFADGVPFLGCFPVEPVSGSVVVIDNEMSPTMLRRWYRDLGVENTDRVMLWPLRGYGRAFDVLDDAVRAELAERLGECDASVLILDCLNPALVTLGLGESSNDDAGRFLAAYDQLLVEAKVADSMIVHHMGHGPERARGASKLLGWPEVNWKYVRERTDDDVVVDGGARFLSAYGRDVDVDESALEYDPATRRLTYVGGDRRVHGVEQHVATVADVVAAAEPYTLNTGEVKAALQRRTGVGNADLQTRIVAEAVSRGLVHSRRRGTAQLFAPGPAPADGSPDDGR